MSAFEFSTLFVMGKMKIKLAISLELTSTPEEADSVLDLAAEELRTAIMNIGRITGKVGIEEILDVVFKDFCIGK